MPLREHLEDTDSFAGSLLVAHPGLGDPHFSKSVVLISAHTPQDGAVGVIINKALGKTLADLKPDFIGTSLQDVPLYVGGPVGSNELILTAWRCPRASNGGDLRLHFGISAEQAEELKESEPDLDIRAFLGYAGWSGGQLEAELREDSWVVTPIVCPVLKPKDGQELWKAILCMVKPKLAYMADMPEDPSVN